jgi:hypothetical protein
VLNYERCAHRRYLLLYEGRCPGGGQIDVRVLVAFEDDYRSYREVIAVGIHLLRPRTEVETAPMEELEERIERFDPQLVVCSPKMGEPYTNAEVARMSFGELSQEDVEGIRTGAIGDPSVGQAVALAGGFGVEPSYLLDRGEPLFDRELVEALRNTTLREATREISRVPEKERRLVLGIVRQFGSENNTRSPQNAGGTAESAREGVHPRPAERGPDTPDLTGAPD